MNELPEHLSRNLLSSLTVVSSFCATGHQIEMAPGFCGNKGADLLIGPPESIPKLNMVGFPTREEP